MNKFSIIAFKIWSEAGQGFVLFDICNSMSMIMNFDFVPLILLFVFEVEAPIKRLRNRARIKSIQTCILRHEWYFNLPHKSFLFYNWNPCYFKNTQKSLNMLNNNLPFLIGLNSCSYFEDPFLLYLAVCVAGLCITLVFISNIPFPYNLYSFIHIPRITLHVCISKINATHHFCIVDVDCDSRQFGNE